MARVPVAHLRDHEAAQATFSPLVSETPYGFVLLLIEHGIRRRAEVAQRRQRRRFRARRPRLAAL